MLVMSPIKSHRNGSNNLVIQFIPIYRCIYNVFKSVDIVNSSLNLQECLCCVDQGAMNKISNKFCELTYFYSDLMNL